MVTLKQVRTWALGAGISRTDLQRHYRSSLLTCISNLTQALCRESLCPFSTGPDRLQLGETMRLTAPARSGLPFDRLQITGWPTLEAPAHVRVLRTGGAFIRAITAIVPAWENRPYNENLRSDFHNSLANMVLNRVLVQLRPCNKIALEPAYQGHQTYPFPGLRLGPSLDTIVACSHLSDAPVKLAAVEFAALLQITRDDEPADGLLAKMLGTRLPAHLASELADAAILLVHPWQLSLSSGLKALLQAGNARVLDIDIPAVPLASQRTCRIQASGYDIKLPVDAVLTGEYRLLYRLNCENAVAVSAAMRSIVEREGMSGFFTGQFDVASLFHPLPALSPSLSAIIREPVPGYGTSCHPAINLWTGACLAKHLVRNADHAEQFFHRYYRTLLNGPLKMLLRHGMATEPHIQNTLFDFDEAGMPSRLIIRDIDATVLDPERWSGKGSASSPLALGADTWTHMPAFSEGCKRTMYAIHFGHMGTVIDFIERFYGCPRQRLIASMNEAWNELTRSGCGPDYAPARIDALERDRTSIRVCLEARVKRDPGLRFTA